MREKEDDNWYQEEEENQQFFDKKQFNFKGGFMYNNIGGKIKFLAKVIAWIGIIASIITGIIWIIIGIANASSGGGISMLIGIGIMIGGFLWSWISSWGLYGYGELIEKTAETAENTAEIARNTAK